MATLVGEEAQRSRIGEPAKRSAAWESAENAATILAVEDGARPVIAAACLVPRMDCNSDIASYLPAALGNSQAHAVSLRETWVEWEAARGASALGGGTGLGRRLLLSAVVEQRDVEGCPIELGWPAETDAPHAGRVLPQVKAKFYCPCPEEAVELVQVGSQHQAE